MTDFLKPMTALLALGALALPAQGQELTNAQQEAAAQFVLNNARHTLLHEIGHLLVDQFDLPVLGREEDAVDAFATLLMLETGTEEDAIALQDTVDGWLHSEQGRPTRGYFIPDFYGAHSLDIQRSFAITCLMVGSDFDRHTLFATRVSLPIDRQNSCAEDFRIAELGWNSVLEPYRRTDDFGARIATAYDDTYGLYDDAKALLEQARILEYHADWIAKTFVMPEPVRVIAEVCGEANAFYDLGTREVILCYEWVDFFHEMFVDEILPAREHFEEMRTLKLEKIGRVE